MKAGKKNQIAAEESAQGSGRGLLDQENKGNHNSNRPDQDAHPGEQDLVEEAGVPFQIADDRINGIINF
jgi:hypothetical protein